LMMNLNFFQRDTTIKASGNPLYDNALSGSDGWLDLRYNVSGFTFFVRADAFNNSNLKNPTQPSTDFGIGAWSVTKDLKDLSMTVGSIYDQVGSGILFRAYEDRGLLIDNALVGIELKYKLTNNILLKGFTGQQKNNSAILIDEAVHTPPYGPVIKGFNAEGDFSAGKMHIIPGIGVLNRTLDINSMNSVVANIDALPVSKRFEPMYNMYAFSAYNTITYKNFSWYLEGAYKTHEAVYEDSLLVNKPGNVEYTSINYGRKGIALSLTGKRTQDFIMRTSPNEVLLNGMMNWQPVVAVLRPERLMSRYTPASQDISEMAGTANLLASPNDVTNLTFTYTNINTLNNVKLYREAYAEAYYQGFKSWIIQLGAQYLEYNIFLYQTRTDTTTKVVYAITPFTEITYRISEKKSLRAEVQYMGTKQDYGSWVFALLEYDIAPKWSVSFSDMYNVSVNKNKDNPNATDPGFSTKKGNNYYNLYVAYTKGANRFSLAYVKQVDGINCTGGVCRYEPAFSGVKATLTSSF
ncbi:MAG: DUF6029 family protein, partial [Chitinophagales bacterium]